MEAVAGLVIGAALALATLLFFAWKWRLGLRGILPFVLALTIVGAGVAAVVSSRSDLAWVWLASLVWILTVGVAFISLVYRFYRDPERMPPDRDDVVLSPADGEVIYISESRHGVLPTVAKSGRRYTLRELVKTSLRATDATVIGIALNFLDVHVNRAPIAGRVVLQRRHGGAFQSLRKLESVFDNERVTIVIERNGFEVAVVLIASRLVRRIVEFVHEGETVGLGQRLGAIRFGSQVDVVIPHSSGFEVLARTGQRVVAGESVLAETGMAHEVEPRRGASRHSGENRVLVAENDRKRQESSTAQIAERRARADRS
jgi:phosphatidylserine decarboxylase